MLARLTTEPRYLNEVINENLRIRFVYGISARLFTIDL